MLNVHVPEVNGIGWGAGVLPSPAPPGPPLLPTKENKRFHQTRVVGPGEEKNDAVADGGSSVPSPAGPAVVRGDPGSHAEAPAGHPVPGEERRPADRPQHEGRRCVPSPGLAEEGRSASALATGTFIECTYTVYNYLMFFNFALYNHIRRSHIHITWLDIFTFFIF